MFFFSFFLSFCVDVSTREELFNVTDSAVYFVFHLFVASKNRWV